MGRNGTLSSGCAGLRWSGGTGLRTARSVWPVWSLPVRVLKVRPLGRNADSHSDMHVVRVYVAVGGHEALQADAEVSGDAVECIPFSDDIITGAVASGACSCCRRYADFCSDFYVIWICDSVERHETSVIHAISARDFVERVACGDFVHSGTYWLF